MLDIYVDADGCPVKAEIYRVAARYDLDVILVANARMRFPARDSIRLVLVDQAFGACEEIQQLGHTVLAHGERSIVETDTDVAFRRHRAIGRLVEFDLCSKMLAPQLLGFEHAEMGNG